MRYVAGIGSRNTPQEYIKVIQEIAEQFVELGYTLRSGGADGSDTYWELAFDICGGSKEIFLPWKNFNHNQSLLHTPPKACFEMAELHHKHYNKLTYGRKCLMARNVQQIFGQNESSEKTSIVICYTNDGCESYKTRTVDTGGTGMTIELASRFNIPVINLKNGNYRERINQFLSMEY